jgi:hypothetical protein
MKLLLVVTIAAVIRAGTAHADSLAGEFDDRAAVAQAETVVAGVFTGATVRRVREQPNAIDAAGRASTGRIELVAHEFAIAELLDGAALPPRISINVPGAVALPSAGQRVVIGVRADGPTPDDGYNLLYGRALAAVDDQRLTDLRAWVRSVRAPEPVAPQAIADRLGQLAAETRSVEPAPLSAPGPDIPGGPGGPHPTVLTGPLRTRPRVIEPMGDPSHPAEPAAAPVVAELPAPPSAPNQVPTPRPPTTAPASSSALATTAEPRRWPYAVLAGALVVLIIVALRRRGLPPHRHGVAPRVRRGASTRRL